jgi:CBS domain-containing protein
VRTTAAVDSAVDGGTVRSRKEAVMVRFVREIMCKDPECVSEDATLRDVAQVMKEAGIGDVLVCDADGRLCGILTDRDLVVRGLAEGLDPDASRAADVCSQRIISLAPEAPLDDAIRLMRDNSVRRIPIVDGDAPIGVVSLGDLARERDPGSALAQISIAPPNA